VDGNQGGVVAEGGLNLGGGDDPGSVGTEEGDGLAEAVEPTAGVQSSEMFVGSGDDVPAAGGVVFRQASDSEVAGLGRAAGEVDFLRPGVDEAGNLLAGVIDGSGGGLAGGVVAGGVGELVTEPGEHGGEDALVDRGGGVEIEVNRKVQGRIHTLPRPRRACG